MYFVRITFMGVKLNFVIEILISFENMVKVESCQNKIVKTLVDVFVKVF